MKWLNLEHFYDGSWRVDSCEGTKYVNGHAICWGKLCKVCLPDSSQCLSVFWDKGAPFLHVWESTSHVKLLWPVSGADDQRDLLISASFSNGFSFQAAMCWESENAVLSPHHILSTFWFYPFKHEESEVSLELKDLRQSESWHWVKLKL